MKRVGMFSGGICSWATAKRVVERHGADDLTLLFCDTLVEDADLYRFLREAAANVFRNMPPNLVWLTEGRTPWQVYRDERFLGNSSVDPCSKILKRQPAARWLAENCDPAETVVYVGIDWSEGHRFTALRDRRAAGGWRYEAPMTEAPYLTKSDMLQWLKREGIAPPRLYAMGFPHNNCGGFCCKMGHGQAALLLREMPGRYAQVEAQEEGIRQFLDRDVSMMTDRSGDGVKKPLTMRALRERIEAGGQVDLFDYGGCGCFVDA